MTSRELKIRQNGTTLIAAAYIYIAPDLGREQGRHASHRE
jgi:hypothetical protein